MNDIPAAIRTIVKLSNMESFDQLNLQRFAYVDSKFVSRILNSIASNDTPEFRAAKIAYLEYCIPAHVLERIWLKESKFTRSDQLYSYEGLIKITWYDLDGNHTVGFIIYNIKDIDTPRTVLPKMSDIMDAFGIKSTAGVILTVPNYLGTNFCLDIFAEPQEPIIPIAYDMMVGHIQDKDICLKQAEQLAIENKVATVKCSIQEG